MPAISPALHLALSTASRAMPSAGSGDVTELATPGGGHDAAGADFASLDFASLLQGQFADVGRSLNGHLAHALPDTPDSNQPNPLTAELAASGQDISLSQLSSTRAQLWASLRSTTTPARTGPTTVEVVVAETNPAASPTTAALLQATPPTQGPGTLPSDLPGQMATPSRASATDKHPHKHLLVAHADGMTRTSAPAIGPQHTDAILSAPAPVSPQALSPEEAMASDQPAHPLDPALAVPLAGARPQPDHETSEEQRLRADDVATTAALPWLAPTTPPSPGHAAPSLPDTPRSSGNPLAADNGSLAAQPTPAIPVPTTAEIAAPTTGADGLAATSADATSPGASQPSAFAQVLHGTTQAHQLPHATAPVPSSTMTTPLHQQGWDQEVGERVVWLAGRQEQRAELVLNPPNLGRIEISLTLQGDQANASFVSPHPMVREALENAMPRLREMFAEAGLSLGQAQVGAESQQQQQASQQAKQGNNPDSPRFFTPDGSSEAVNMTHGGMDTALSRGHGLVDTFV